MKISGILILFFALVLIPLTTVHASNGELTVRPLHLLGCGELVANPSIAAGGSVILVAPVSGASDLLAEAERLIAPSENIFVFFPPDSELPTKLGPKTKVFHLPRHNPGETPATAIQRGVFHIAHLIPEAVYRNTKVIVGAESGVDWGMALRIHYGDQGYEGSLAPWEMVSKLALNRLGRANPIKDLIWPEMWAASQFETDLKIFAEANPNAGVVAKLDNSSGMNGLRIGVAHEAQNMIDELMRMENKHQRQSSVIVEQKIDDIPLPAGLHWREVAFDGDVFTHDGVTDLLLFSAFLYEKDHRKMYLSDTLDDPHRARYAHVAKVMLEFIRLVRYRAGGIHFEVYMPCDVNGVPVGHGPYVLGDANWRHGGNNRFSRLLYDRGVFSMLPSELLLRSSLAPETLLGLQITTRAKEAKVFTLSFPRAPLHAVFAFDPSHVVRSIRGLRSFGQDSIMWDSTNYLKAKVGAARELKDAIDVVLTGSPEQIETDGEELRRLEISLEGAMRAVRP